VRVARSRIDLASVGYVHVAVGEVIIGVLHACEGATHGDGSPRSAARSLATRSKMSREPAEGRTTLSRASIWMSSMVAVLAWEGAAQAQSARRDPPPSATGRLPPEVIQRVIRQRMDRFRACYNDVRRTNPRLEGRVTVRFLINRDGTVATASDAGSDMRDRGVISCVLRNFYALTFPRPEGGAVAVSFPISFSPDM
jgi:hypothetical protein